MTILVAILAAAFVARLGARLVTGEAHFWTNSYSFLYDLAAGIAKGDGFCKAADCERQPLYLLFIALTTLAGKNYLFIVIPQALMGAGTAGLAFLIARRMFNSSAALIACAVTAFYPYYVIHDTALQDTAMVTFALALSVWLLLRASQDGRGRDWLIAGIALGALVLVRISMAPTVAAVLLWAIAWGTSGALVQRLRSWMILVAGIILTLSPWLVHTYRATGTPLLSTDTGFVLWAGNNAQTFLYYPDRSIDLSTHDGLVAMSAADHADRASLRRDRVAVDNWYRARALAFMREDPWRNMHYAARKLTAAFSWTFNPYRGMLAQWIYAASYVPVAIFGIAGMVMARRRPETALIVALYAAFIAVSAVIFAHTSHRMPLDIYWIVFAASVISARATSRSV
ncbi:MAG: glycosyltransferase family 39 protein [Pseudolabrys sp.]|nr:glycosyltransferase family 39 protein [Pseudolabrys sp.]